MQTPQTTYKFIGKVLPDGHLSIPADLAAENGREYEVTVRPLDETLKTVSLQMDGKIEKTDRFEDIVLPAEKIAAAIESTFGTANITCS